MIDQAELTRLLRGLLQEQSLGVLATQSDGQPHASLVAFVAAPDSKSITFATARATRKFSNLHSAAKAAILIDSRGGGEADFHAATAVTAAGTVREVIGEHRDALLVQYLAKHPHLRDFVMSPTVALMQLTVSSYSIVSRFQSVTELQATL